jgi:uncharacterized protein (TIGR02246 family)
MKEAQVTSLTGTDLLDNLELERLFCEGMAQRNVEQVMSCFWNSPGVIFVDFEANVFLGSDNVRKVIEGFLAQFESLHLVIDEITRFRAGETVLAVGTATYEMQMKDGTSRRVTERWTDVRVKADGRWVYAMDHIHLLASPSP